MEPWLAKLEQGDTEAAWDHFLERYRRLIFVTIRYYAEDYDDVMEIFTRLCGALRENNLARLRRYSAQKTHSARFSTWLVAVVRNQTIDWFRHRDGRKRLSALARTLPPLQQKIFEYVFHSSRSHVDAYELLRTRDGIELSFGDFLRALSATYRAVSERRRGHVLRELVGSPLPSSEEPATETRDSSFDLGSLLADALAALEPEDRLAVQLFVIDELPAREVARIIGWADPKTVYNRVYRALAVIRAGFESRGIGPGDL